MKTKYLLLIFALCLFIPNMASQDILGGIQQVAEMENEEHGNNSGNSQGLTDEEQQQAEEYWEENTKDAMDFINGLDKPNHQCLALLGIYSYQMIQLQIAVDEAESCQEKYDLMGMQLLMLTAGTTLMPCTEELANRTSGGAENLMDEFYSSLFSCTEANAYKWTALAEKAPRAVTKILVGYFGPPCDAAEDYDSEGDLEKVLFYFHPKSLLDNIFDLGMRMEALGCGG